MKADSWVVIVMPSLVAVTGALPELTGGGGGVLGEPPDPGPVPVPPEPAAKASPGMARAEAPTANNGTT